MPRSKKAASTPRLDLVEPRPLNKQERSLYELLVDDLAETVTAREKARKQREKLGFTLTAIESRERKVRDQLRVFEPELQGLQAA